MDFSGGYLDFYDNFWLGGLDEGQAKGAQELSKMNEHKYHTLIINRAFAIFSVCFSTLNPSQTSTLKQSRSFNEL